MTKRRTQRQFPHRTKSGIFRNLETGVAASQVVAKRVGIMAAYPSPAGYLELQRMVTEKLFAWPAYGFQVGLGYMSALAKFSARSLQTWPPNAGQGSRLASAYVELMGDMMGAQQVAARPIQRAVVKNAQRLNKYK